MNQSTVTINARKFDGTIHRSWKAELLEQTDSLLTLLGVFEKEVDHPELGFIRPGTISYEYYWLDRWFNVFRFHEPGGALRNYYCNINLPPCFAKGCLDYIDLDIDLLVWPDFRCKLLDFDEFERHAEFYGYGAEIKSKAAATVDELRQMIETRQFPFR